MARDNRRSSPITEYAETNKRGEFDFIARNYALDKASLAEDQKHYILLNSF